MTATPVIDLTEAQLRPLANLGSDAVKLARHILGHLAQANMPIMGGVAERTVSAAYLAVASTARRAKIKGGGNAVVAELGVMRDAGVINAECYHAKKRIWRVQLLSPSGWRIVRDPLRVPRPGDVVIAGKSKQLRRKVESVNEELGVSFSQPNARDPKRTKTCSLVGWRRWTSQNGRVESREDVVEPTVEPNPARATRSRSRKGAEARP